MGAAPKRVTKLQAIASEQERLKETFARLDMERAEILQALEAAPSYAEERRILESAKAFAQQYEAHNVRLRQLVEDYLTERLEEERAL